MKDTVAAKRYGEAFILYARDTIGVEKAVEDCRNIRNLVRENPEFIALLRNPVMTYAEKSDFIDRLLGKDFSDEFKHFLKLLTDKRRIDDLPEIAEYLWMAYSRKAQVSVALRSAFTLDIESVEALRSVLEKRFSKKVKFDIEMDKDLLGGVQVAIGNTIIDGSIRRNLSDLREKLSLTRVT
ncbi:MAG: ATP synthase F1 subunit delta [Candidatus Omnitrophica bacterium]|nr:ATP synthase F1 subunit delta [Candidatus Omnitrophota bacterium]MDD5654236.1 ATP synthase F1 subunit delta [Candidatus Omnitrophota bacterium]